MFIVSVCHKSNLLKPVIENRFAVSKLLPVHVNMTVEAALKRGTFVPFDGVDLIVANSRAQATLVPNTEYYVFTSNWDKL